jgi:hypothetical protein
MGRISNYTKKPNLSAYLSGRSYVNEYEKKKGKKKKKKKKKS